ncbi:MAG: CPBP family intramembrane metalloprotease [Anaerolineae bacterium]|nr:CPBP family intramembrane metalloprotease [Anaerolineae bacterium]
MDERRQSQNKRSNLFWNGQQGRVRAFWRLAAQFVLMLILFLLLSIPMPDEAGKLLGNTLPLGVATVGSVWLAGRFLDRRRFADFGFHCDRAWWADFAFGLALGAGLLATIFLVQWAAGWIAVTGTWRENIAAPGFGAAMVSALLDCLCVGVYEELFSRGYHLKNLSEGLGGALGAKGATVAAVLISSAVFGLLHLLNANATVLGAFDITVAGVMLATGYLLTGELAIPIGIHITWNFFQGAVFGYPVSGYAHPASLTSIRLLGNPLVTGGDFGPEASLVGLGACLVGIVAIVAWVRRRDTTARRRDAKFCVSTRTDTNAGN